MAGGYITLRGKIKCVNKGNGNFDNEHKCWHDYQMAHFFSRFILEFLAQLKDFEKLSEFDTAARTLKLKKIVQLIGMKVKIINSTDILILSIDLSQIA